MIDDRKETNTYGRSEVFRRIQSNIFQKVLKLAIAINRLLLQGNVTRADKEERIMSLLLLRNAKDAFASF